MPLPLALSIWTSGTVVSAAVATKALGCGSAVRVATAAVMWTLVVGGLGYWLARSVWG